LFEENIFPHTRVSGMGCIIKIKNICYAGGKREKVYTKLVRNEIPSIIENDSEIPVTRILSDDEYRIELHKKLKEECNEVLEAKTKEEIIEGLADVLEIIKAISELNGEYLEKVIETSNQKRLKEEDLQEKYF